MSGVKVFSTATCYQADRAAIDRGRLGVDLMEAAGSGIAEQIFSEFSPCPVQVFCGPGANGGDGYVVARHLYEAGWPVFLTVCAKTVPATDADKMEQALPSGVSITGTEISCNIGLIVDCIFGAGLKRPISGELAELVNHINAHPAKVVSADLPSGIFGDNGKVSPPAIKADMTVTFECLKPAHVLEPARSQCGKIKVIAIGFPDGLLDNFDPVAIVNQRNLWPEIPKAPEAVTHKHSRGRLLVMCGGALHTGAARLAARAGLRIGAGWVTLAGSKKSMQVCAAHETSVVLLARDRGEPVSSLLQAQNPDCIIIGPAGGVGKDMRRDVLELLAHNKPTVLDADALSSFADDPDTLFDACHSNTVLLPHEGEFARLFGQLGSEFGNKIERVQAAARLAGCTLLLKGADSVMATASGRIVVNTHTSGWLASLGSGDVLAGMVAGLMAQGHRGFEALCAAVWMHGELGRRLGPGLIAEDLPKAIPLILRDLL